MSDTGIKKHEQDLLQQSGQSLSDKTGVKTSDNSFEYEAKKDPGKRSVFDTNPKDNQYSLQHKRQLQSHRTREEISVNSFEYEAEKGHGKRSVFDTSPKEYDQYFQLKDRQLLSHTTKEEISVNSFEYGADKDHGKSLYSRYHEELAKEQEQGNRKPDWIHGSVAEFSHSTEGISFHPDDVQDLLMSGNLPSLPARKEEFVTDSRLQKGATNLMPNASDGHGEEDFEDFHMDFESLHEIRSTHDDIWTSIRKISKKIEEGEAISSYHDVTDKPNETKLPNGNHRTQTLAKQDQSNLSSTSVNISPSTSPLGKGRLTSLPSKSSQGHEIMTSSHKFETVPSASKKLSFTDQKMSSMSSNIASSSYVKDDDFPLSSQEADPSYSLQNSGNALPPGRLLSYADVKSQISSVTNVTSPHELLKPSSASKTSHNRCASDQSVTTHRTSSRLQDKLTQSHKPALSENDQRYSKLHSGNVRTLNASVNERIAKSSSRNDKATKSSSGNERATKSSSRKERTTESSSGNQRITKSSSRNERVTEFSRNKRTTNSWNSPNKSRPKIYEPAVDSITLQDGSSKSFGTSNLEYVCEDPVDINSTMTSSGTFRLEDLDTSADEIHAPNKQGFSKNDDAYKIRVARTKEAEEMTTSGKRLGTEKNSIGGGIRRNGTRYAMQTKKSVKKDEEYMQGLNHKVCVYEKFL